MPRNQEFRDDVEANEMNQSPRAKKHPCPGAEPGTTRQDLPDYHIEREDTVRQSGARNRGTEQHDESKVSPSADVFSEGTGQGDETSQGSTLTRAGLK